MFPVPYRKTHLVSPHSAEVIAERLRVHTSRRWPWFRSPAPQFDFVGSVSLTAFRLLPTRRGRTTYQPWLFGRMTPRPNGGTEIQIVQTLHPAGIIIIVSFLILALLLWSRAEYYGGAGLFTAGLFFLHGLMYCIGFLPQARRAEERIRQLAMEVESSEVVAESSSTLLRQSYP
jgi:hypothetical protein